MTTIHEIDHILQDRTKRPSMQSEYTHPLYKKEGGADIYSDEGREQYMKYLLSQREIESVTTALYYYLREVVNREFDFETAIDVYVNTHMRISDVLDQDFANQYKSILTTELIRRFPHIREIYDRLRLPELERMGRYSSVDRILRFPAAPPSPLLSGFWIAPNGEEFPFPGSSAHYYWVMQNLNMLREKTGFDAEDATAMQIYLRDHGWVQARLSWHSVAVIGKDIVPIKAFIQKVSETLTPERLEMFKVHYDNGNGAFVESELSDWL
jgi:hypothetical protein